MKKILLNNLSLKLLALLLGIILWIAVMYSLNPMTTKTITVPVNILYESVLTERDWMYTVQGKREAEVTVKAKSIDLAKITEDDIYLYADFRYLEGSSTERRATISYQLKNSAIESLVFVGNNYLTINLEEVITREFDIDVQISGSVAENYTADKEPTAVPKTITVKGPKSQVQRIAKVVYYLYIKDANEDIKESGAPTLLDAAGDVLTDLENVTITPETVDIVLPIYQTKNVKLVVDTDTITGTPATGYALSGVTLSKESVQIAGYRDIIAGMTSISIPGDLIDITGREDSLITEIDLDKTYSKKEAENFVNKLGLGSSTVNLIWVNTYTQSLYVFKGSKGKWKVQKGAWDVSTGLPKTPTPTGTTRVGSKSRGCYDPFPQTPWWCVCRAGFSIHGKAPYYPAMGAPASHGCVRNWSENAKWMYEHIPVNTTVHVF